MNRRGVLSTAVLAYLLGFSSIAFAADEIGPEVGSPAPDFTLAAVTDGTEHTLSAHLGERPVVMVFFRGSW